MDEDTPNMHVGVDVEGQHQDLDFTVPHEVVESGVNIDRATEVLERAEAGHADTEEVNETVKTLQSLQNDGFYNSQIRSTLARLIAARGG